MKKFIAVALSAMTVMSSFTFMLTVNAADNEEISFDLDKALYVHAVSGSADTEAWQAWQSEHDEDFQTIKSDVKYFFLPTSAQRESLDVYNAFSKSVTLNGVTIDSGETATVSLTEDSYKVSADGKTYTLKIMKSNAEAAIYINNSDADGNGTDLMDYLNNDKSRSAKASGAIVDEDGNIDNTKVKKIKGRGNTTWDKPKKAYNITYDENVSIAGMAKGKKYSILANYQDDSLSRNRFLYDLSDAVGMPYASDSRYVDFYVNGFYWGSYQMTEKVETGKNTLIPDFSEDDYLNEDGTVKEDFPFVCEVDASAKDGEDYYFKASSGSKITIKSPELDADDPNYSKVKKYVKTKYDAFFSAVKSSTKEVSDYADVDSLVKMYFINELGKNWDSGVSSLFFTYKQDSEGKYKFYASPVWDFDNSLGNANGVEYDLKDMGVDDYTEYTGWWCKYKGKSSNKKSTSNIMNYIARNEKIQALAPEVWFTEFVPAINDFANNKNTDEMYGVDTYYYYIKGSAEMNYQSGWLLNTGKWIADHSKLNKASFNMNSGKYTVSDTATKYENNFDGMYNYCVDWMLSRAAWLSSQLYEEYNPVPQIVIGDVDGDGIVKIQDATLLQRALAEVEVLDENQLAAADADGDGAVLVQDVTTIMRYIAGQIDTLG